jgi:hypothetical protein
MEASIAIERSLIEPDKLLTLQSWRGVQWLAGWRNKQRAVQAAERPNNVLEVSFASRRSGQRLRLDASLHVSAPEPFSNESSLP